MEIQWKAYEYEYKKKNPDWFWALWIVSAAMIFISIMFDSSLFAILVFIATFTLSLQAAKKPNLVSFEINQSGISVDDKRYSYKEIFSYDIKDEENKIILKPKNKLVPLLIIPLSKEIDKQKIDGFLSDYLEKEDLEEPFTDKLAKYL